MLKQTNSNYFQAQNERKTPKKDSSKNLITYQTQNNLKRNEESNPVMFETNQNPQKDDQKQQTTLMRDISQSVLVQEEREQAVIIETIDNQHQQQVQQDVRASDIQDQQINNKVEVHDQDLKQTDKHELLEVVDSKYGDKQIDLSGFHQEETSNQSINLAAKDPSRPQNLKVQPDQNEPLPSHSNRVNIGEFSVGNYKEFQLREDLANLIQKYNKQFYGDAKKPNVRKDFKSQEKDSRYKDKMILNPIAVPDPSQAEGNYSWMYLMTPYYNQLSKEIQTNQLENNILQQHFEYYLEMEKEKDLLAQEFEELKAQEKRLQQQMHDEQMENQHFEEKMMHMERNLKEIHPEKFRELNIKLEQLNGTLKAKDNIIDQLINEITLAKNEKDDIQNEVLFRKQRIENFSIEFNTKELEYQRLWSEEQNLKTQVRGEDNISKDALRENEGLQREIALARDDLNQNHAVFENLQMNIYERKGVMQDLESKLRYANEVIMQLESENQSLALDLAHSKSAVESQNRAYNELRSHYHMVSSGQSDGILNINSSNPIISIPKIVMPSTYFKPSIVHKATINLLPSSSKALSQQVTPQNIRSYLSVKKTTIDLTSDLKTSRDQKVRFSMDTPGGVSNLPTRQSMNAHNAKRADSVDAQIKKRNYNSLLPDDSSYQSPQPTAKKENQYSNRGGSVNRNFIDSMGGILGMSEEKQQIVNMRASVQNNTFPLKKIDVGSPLPQSPSRDYPQQTPERKTYMETDISTDYQRDSYFGDQSRMSTMSTQTPFKNKVSAKNTRGSQPQQQKQSAYTARAYGQREENKYRENTWQERMDQLPRNSAYRSSIAFGEDGIYSKDEQGQGNNKRNQNKEINQSPQTSYQPFQVARDYDIDVDALNGNDPQAKAQLIKFKQQKIYDLSDQRKLLQSQVQHIPEHSKSVTQRQQKQELDNEIQKLSKRISMLKYDIKKMTCKEEDGQKSPSPEDQNGARDIIQRIQMKNIAFMPAQAALQNQSNQNQFNISQSQQSKVSPPRQVVEGAIVIPVNQIKLVKKENASPSPEARQISKNQISPKSIVFVQKTEAINVQNGINSIQNRKAQNKAQINTQLSDEDETNVNSDDEERISQLSQIKPNQNHFNRPKLQTNVHQSTFVDQSLQSQRTQRGSALQNFKGCPESNQRVKVINPSKIKNSPSPVSHIQKKEDQQKPHKLLASDFIKGMINQSRTNTNLLTQNSTQKKIIGVIRSNNTSQQLPIKQSGNHNEIKPSQEKLQCETSKQNENQIEQPQKLLIKKIQHMRNYSPPPTYDTEKQSQIIGIVIKDCKTTNKQPNNQEQPDQKKEDQSSVFQFPFQRRARSTSLSSPKEEIIKSKLGRQDNNQQKDEKSQSPYRQQETQESKRNKPVVANVNFIITQNGLKKQEDEDAVFERNKEVDEWLMGSGQSDATAASQNSNQNFKGVKSPQNLIVQKKQQSELELPIQPKAQSDDHMNEEGDMEDWMFKTFDKHKTNANTKITGRRLNEQTQSLENEKFEDNPFDMAPEMQKQFIKPQLTSDKDLLSFESLADDCNDLSQYIDKIDQFMFENVL